MLGKKKLVYKGKSVFKRVDFDGFSLTEKNGALVAKSAVNCDCKEGVLRSGIGVERMTRSDGAEFRIRESKVEGAYRCALADTKDSVGLGEEKPYYYVAREDGELYELYESGLGVRVATVGRKVYHRSLPNELGYAYELFCGDSALIEMHFKAGYGTGKKGDIRGFTLCGGRIFFAFQDRYLYYGKPHTYYQYYHTTDSSGKLYLAPDFGALIGVASDGEYVYAFMQRGIYQIKPSGEMCDFRMENVPYGGGEILKGSFVETGGGVIFLSTKGAHRLIRGVVKSICEELKLSPSVAFECRVATCEDLVMIDFGEKDLLQNEVRKRVAIYRDGSYGYLTSRTGVLSGSEYTCAEGYLAKFVANTPSARYSEACGFESQETDFGDKKRKWLDKIVLRGEGKTQVVLRCGDRQMSFEAEFENGVWACKLREKGERFSFRFLPVGGAKVYGVSVEYHYVEE